MEKINYQRRLDKILENIGSTGDTPSLLLHSCCAPCSSYVLEYLSRFFRITVFYYNPNIYPESEYEKRVAEQERLIDELPAENPVAFIAEGYDHGEFLSIASGLEDALEGGERCFKCYELRLRRAARLAKAGGFDYFTTTLSISPLKNAQKLNEIAERIAAEYGVPALPADFKKREGYKRSIELSNKYGLYRQNYCGCEFSKKRLKNTEDRDEQLQT